MIGREEFNAADHGGTRSFDRGVAVETLEVIIRPFLQSVEQRAVILVGGARAELIEAVADTAIEVGNDAAEMVRNDLEAGIAVQDPGEHETGERHGGFQVLRAADALLADVGRDVHDRGDDALRDEAAGIAQLGG